MPIMASRLALPILANCLKLSPSRPGIANIGQPPGIANLGQLPQSQPPGIANHPGIANLAQNWAPAQIKQNLVMPSQSHPRP